MVMKNNVYSEAFLALLRACGLESEFREKFLLRHRDVNGDCIALEEWLNNVMPRTYLEHGIPLDSEELWSSFDKLWQVRVGLLEKDVHKDELRCDYVMKVKIMESMCADMKGLVNNYRWDVVEETLQKMNDMLVEVVQIRKELLDACKGK